MSLPSHTLERAHSCHSLRCCTRFECPCRGEVPLLTAGSWRDLPAEAVRNATADLAGETYRRKHGLEHKAHEQTAVEAAWAEQAASGAVRVHVTAIDDACPAPFAVSKLPSGLTAL